MERYYSMVNGKYDTTQKMINKLQELHQKTKYKFYQKISNYNDEINIRRQT